MSAILGGAYLAEAEERLRLGHPHLAAASARAAIREAPTPRHSIAVRGRDLLARATLEAERVDAQRAELVAARRAP